MNTMMLTDFHSHVLPGIDDGSASLEESIAMLKMEAAQGVTRVVATPHFYPQYDSPEKFLARRAEAEAQLREEMTKHEGLPELIVGAEVYFFRGISEFDSLSGLTTDEKSSILLLEMPMTKWTQSMYAEILGIYEKQGLTPVIAHVDRYMTPLNTQGIPSRLEQMPVYVQANASSFLRPGMRWLMTRLLKEDRIHLLGSDCHNLEDRQPNLGEAVKMIQKYAGSDAIRQIRAHEDRVLNCRKKIRT